MSLRIAAKRTAKRILPLRIRAWLRGEASPWPPVGSLQFGSLRRVTPVSGIFGLDRGRSIDRYYIENFLARNETDISEHVLEIANNTYTRRFGGERVTRSDVLHVEEGNPNATIVADLTVPNNLPSDGFDCIILTQTLPFIFDTRAAIGTLYRILKHGGVLLATFPGICQISRYDMERWGDYWRFTTLSARRLFEEVFPPSNITVDAHGNVLVATAYLYGLAVEELRQDELDYNDQDYQVVITVRATK